MVMVLMVSLVTEVCLKMQIKFVIKTQMEMKMQTKFFILSLLLMFTVGCSDECDVCNNEYKCYGIYDSHGNKTIVREHTFVVNDNLTFVDECDASAKYELALIEAGLTISYGTCECND